MVMEKEKIGFAESLVEILFNVLIFLPPFLYGAIIAAILYFNIKSFVGVILAVLSLILGAAGGVYFIRKRTEKANVSIY